MKRLAFALAFIFLPATAIAAGAFEVSGLDRSMDILGMVFGQMGTLPVGGGGNPLFASMIQIMNQIIFFLGIIIVLYTGLTSTIQTAQEGEVMGKKWSTIWTPVRAAFGLFLLLPSPNTGYSYIQIVIMYFIIQGVGAANALWERVVDGMLRGESVANTVSENSSGQSARQAEVSNQEDTMRKLLRTQLCTYQFNSEPELQALVNDEPITLFRWGDSIIWGTLSNNQAVCGKITIQSFGGLVLHFQQFLSGTGTLNQDPLKRIFYDTITSSSFEMEPIAEEAFLEPNPGNRTLPANLLPIARLLETGAQDILQYYAYLSNQNQALYRAKLEGWILAAQYYTLMITGAATENVPFTVNFAQGYEGPEIGLKNLMSEGDAALLDAQYTVKASQTFTEAHSMLGDFMGRERLGQGLNLVQATDAGKIPGWEETIGRALKELAFLIVDSIHGDATTTASGDKVYDPLIAISTAGQEIMLAIEILFWVMVVVLPLLAIASTPPCANPLWGTITVVIYVLCAIVLLLVGTLWTAGVVMGLYVPLIPWLVFTFCAIGWLILVIEAMVASPLIALILIVPSEDEMGKVGHSIVILLGLIFRPALMILGLIFSIKVMMVIVSMIDYGFKELILTNIGNVGVFGAIAIIIIYCGVITTVIHQCFSLIYVVPDKVLRWMGGQPESQDVMSKVKGIKGSAEKGAAAGGAAMKGVAGAGMKKAGG